MIQLLGNPDLNTIDNRERIKACKEDYDLGLEPLQQEEAEDLRAKVSEWYEANKESVEAWFKMYTQKRDSDQ